MAAKHGFSMYPIMCKLFGARYVEVDNKPDWSHDLKGMLQAITPQTRLVFITNPTNPLGTMVFQEEMDRYENSGKRRYRTLYAVAGTVEEDKLE